MNILEKILKSTKPFSSNKNEIKIDKDGFKSIVTISYKIKIIDSVRFIAILSSNLINNHAEGNHKTKCKDCDCFFNINVSATI